MKKQFVKVLSTVLTLILIIGTFTAVPVNAAVNTSGMGQSELEKEIDRLEKENASIQSTINSLKNQKNKQLDLKRAIEKQIANIQSQIDVCNREILKINNTVAKNKAEIEKKNNEMEALKRDFKKRLRAIYMSNTGSNVQILLGADDFAHFLELSQLTAAVSARDKKLIEDIVEAVKAINIKIEENNKLLNSQVAIKNTVAAKQNELQKQNSAIQGVINTINSQQKNEQAVINKNQADIIAMQNALNDILHGSSGSSGSNDGNFLWPVPGFRRVSSGFGSRWGTNHNGVDIAQSGISGARVVAIADGTVYMRYNSCTHNYGKNGTCCGQHGNGYGYGNFVAVDHGTGPNGVKYKAYYAHMSRAIVANGAKVKKGQTLGYVGSTGWSTGYHLHFGLIESRYNSSTKKWTDKWVDPMKYY